MNIGAIYKAVDQHGRLCSAQLAIFGSLYLPASGGKSCENNKKRRATHGAAEERGGSDAYDLCDVFCDLPLDSHTVCFRVSRAELGHAAAKGTSKCR